MQNFNVKMFFFIVLKELSNIKNKKLYLLESQLLSCKSYIKILNDIKTQQNNILLKSQDLTRKQRTNKILSLERNINNNFNFNIIDNKIIQFFKEILHFVLVTKILLLISLI